MTGIVRIEQPVERIERFHSLQGGQYWRANEAIAEENIAASGRQQTAYGHSAHPPIKTWPTHSV